MSGRNRNFVDVVYNNNIDLKRAEDFFSASIEFNRKEIKKKLREGYIVYRIQSEYISSGGPVMVVHMVKLSDDKGTEEKTPFQC